MPCSPGLHEAHPGPGDEQGRWIPVGVEDLHRGGPDELPPARRLPRVDPGELAGQPERSRRDPRARCGPPRQVPARMSNRTSRAIVYVWPDVLVLLNSVPRVNFATPSKDVAILMIPPPLKAWLKCVILQILHSDRSIITTSLRKSCSGASSSSLSTNLIAMEEGNIMTTSLGGTDILIAKTRIRV